MYVGLEGMGVLEEFGVGLEKGRVSVEERGYVVVVSGDYVLDCMVGNDGFVCVYMM